MLVIAGKKKQKKRMCAILPKSLNADSTVCVLCWQNEGKVDYQDYG